MTTLNTNLTFEWLEELQAKPDSTTIDAPERSQAELTAHCLATCKLSRATRVRMELSLVRAAKQRAKFRGAPPRRAKGSKHHNSKKATAKRKYEHNWFTNPWACTVYGYGMFVIPKAVWDEHIGPLWKMYDPAQMKVKLYKQTMGKEWLGTYKHPYTIYTMDIIHSTRGILYRGCDQELYDLSKPKLQELDSIQPDLVRAV